MILLELVGIRADHLGYRKGAKPTWGVIYGMVGPELQESGGNPGKPAVKLPHTSRCHLVFNVSALRAYEKNAIPNRRQPTPPPITNLDGHTRYVVENILSHRRRQNQLQYLVKWQGYSDATWEPEHYLLDESGNDIVPLQKYKTLAYALSGLDILYQPNDEYEERKQNDQNK